MNLRRKPPPAEKRLLWRYTPGEPKGEWVDAANHRPAKVKVRESNKESSTWAMSSFDLRYGADISDVSETVPGDLLDHLFPPKSDPAKTSDK